MFDPAARQEYLTGFHKRKLQRAKHAQEIAEKRAREEKIAGRKKVSDCFDVHLQTQITTDPMSGNSSAKNERQILSGMCSK